MICSKTVPGRFQPALLSSKYGEKPQGLKIALYSPLGKFNMHPLYAKTFDLY